MEQQRPKGWHRMTNSTKKSSDQKSLGKPTIIKKYANRRLYNTQSSTYITLDFLANMVRENQDFTVIDAKTEEDLTRQILTQIIFEEEAKGQSMLPVNFLRQIIRLYGDVLQGAVPNYLDLSMQALLSNQQQFRDQINKTISEPIPLTPIETMARSQMDWYDTMVKFFDIRKMVPSAISPSAEPPLETDMVELKRQIRDMQTRIDSIVSGKAGG